MYFATILICLGVASCEVNNAIVAVESGIVFESIGACRDAAMSQLAAITTPEVGEGDGLAFIVSCEELHPSNLVRGGGALQWFDPRGNP